MRTVTNSAFTIQYPDDTVLSGDLNKLTVTKNTTATHIELSFTISGYNYAENLYFFGTNPIEFSMSDILKLLFDRSYYAPFDTTKQFNFTIKLYNNTSLIDTQNLTINNVILGKRRVFDKYGEFKNFNEIELNVNSGMDYFYYYFPSTTNVYIKFLDGSFVFLDNFAGLSAISLNDYLTVIDTIDYLFYSSTPFDITFDSTFTTVEKIYLSLTTDASCSSNENVFSFRFLNRFGMFRHYFIKSKAENITSDKGISLLFLENNTTELNNLFSEQKKSYAQSMSFYRDSLTKELVNDFSDCIYSEHCHIYDSINNQWLPVRVQTNTFNIEAKETLFDVSLNIILQANNE